MQFVYTGSDILQGNAAYTADGSCKVFINDFLGDTNSFKNLGSLIGLYGRDSHLGSDLYNAVDHSAVVVIDCRIIIFVQQLFLDQFLDGLQRQIRVYRAGAVS